jgi:predicted ATPase
MDKEILQNRINDLDKALVEALAQYHQIFGRLQETKYFLEQMAIQELVDQGEPV